MSLLKTVAYFALLAVFCEACENPQVTYTSFTTQDARIVTKIAYISDFTVKCNGGEPASLYAQVNNNILPVSTVGQDQYQVSWTEETKAAYSGDTTVRIFNEDGYAALRKALRAGEDLSAIPSLAEVVVNHPGAYNGPWVKRELLAAVLSVVVAYFAVSFKLKVAA